jgi:bacillithiol system protein YtxJ
MSDMFGRLENIDDLEKAFQRSDDEPVVLFNHDPWCPISARAHHIMSSIPRPIALIDVSQSRDLTREIARRTGIRHESPQVLVVRNREACWSSSHSAITVDGVVAALQSADSDIDTPE